MEYFVLLLLVVVIGCGLYLYHANKSGSDGTGEPKPVKGKSKGKELAVVESVIESEAVIELPRHEIVRTWIGSSVIGSDTFHWKCSCGRGSMLFVKRLAQKEAREHVDNGNHQVELQYKTGGRFGW